jgi:hypothetical protein
MTTILKNENGCHLAELFVNVCPLLRNISCSCSALQNNLCDFPNVLAECTTCRNQLRFPSDNNLHKRLAQF